MSFLACIVKFFVALGGLVGAALAVGVGLTALLDYWFRVPLYLGAALALTVVLLGLAALFALVTLWRTRSARSHLPLHRRAPARPVKARR